MRAEKLPETHNSQNPWRVALIEDNDADSMYIKRLSRKLGCLEMQRYATAEEALQNIEDLQRVSCVLMDHSLPDMNGLECLLTLKKYEDVPPIIMLSGCHDEVVVIETLKNGAKDYLIKDHLTEESLKRSLLNTIEKHEIEQELESRNAEARQFASILSHDLKSPMRVISLVSEQLYFELGDLDPDRERCLDFCGEIHKNTEYVKRLIEGLIGFMQHGRSKNNFVTLDLDDLVNRIIAATTFSKDCEKQPKIKVSPLPTIRGDRVGLTQVFQNLIDNSVKYNQNIPEIEISASETTREHIISIKDNGIGIAPENFKKIFLPLHRLHTKDNYDGSGIGLALVQKIMRQHDGDISIESSEGEGTTFHLSFAK